MWARRGSHGGNGVVGLLEVSVPEKSEILKITPVNEWGRSKIVLVGAI